MRAKGDSSTQHLHGRSVSRSMSCVHVCMCLCDSVCVSVSGVRLCVCVSVKHLKRCTLWLFNIAMENGPFIDGLPGFTY